MPYFSTPDILLVIILKTSKKTTLICSIALSFVVLFSLTGTGSAFGNKNIVPFREVNDISDNGYKYPLVADTVVSGLYTEWWYFQAVDFENGIYFTFYYEIDNPDSQSLDGMEIPHAAYCAAEGWFGEKTFSWGGAVDFGEFSASVDSLNVNIAGNTIIGDMNTVECIGTDITNGVSWNLVYTRDEASGTYTDTVPTGFSETDVLGWCCFMPRADVTGFVVIDGETFSVNIDNGGYADHNWGSPEMLSYLPWAGSFSEDMIVIGEAVPAMNGRTNDKGFVNIWNDGEWIFFKVPNVRYTWDVDAETGMPYVTEFSVMAMSIDNKWLLNVKISLVGSYFFDVFDFGAYQLAFFKSFEFVMEGKLRHLTFPDILYPISIDAPCAIEENFFIVAE